MTDKTEKATAEVVKTELDTGVEEVTHAVAEITKMDVVIAELEQKYGKTILPVDSPKGLKVAKEARAEIRKPRHLIEKLRKAGKAPILELGRKLDARAKDMTERLLAIEGPIDEAIKEEETRAERERQAKIEAEMRRVEGIKERIEDIRNSGEAVAWDTPAADIAAAIATVEKIAIDETFEEFEREADDAKAATLTRLREQHEAAKEREAEEARIAEERAELERLRANEERASAIRKRINEIRAAAMIPDGARTSEELHQIIRTVQDIEIDDSFEEFTQEALEAQGATLVRLQELRDIAVGREEAEAKRQAELEERERQVAADRKQEARRQDVRNQIRILQTLPTQGYVDKSAAELSRLLARAESFAIEWQDDDCQEIKQEADKAKRDTIAALRSMLKRRQKYEAEQRELAREKQEREEAERAEADRRRKAEAAAKKAQYPGDDAIVDALVERFEITAFVARQWLKQYGKKKAAAA